MKVPIAAFFVPISFLLFSCCGFAQDSIKPIRTHTHPPPLPIPPQFPGGKDALASYIKKHTCYPKTARKNHITGTIEVDFVVTKNGELKNISILKPLGYGCDEAALKLVKRMPRWEPGRIGRDSIELDYHVNIPFGNIADSKN